MRRIRVGDRPEVNRVAASGGGDSETPPPGKPAQSVVMRLRAAFLLTLPVFAALLLAKASKFLLLWFVLQSKTWHTAEWLAGLIASWATVKVGLAAGIGFVIWRRLFPRHQWAFPLVAAAGFIALKTVHGLIRGDLDLLGSTLLRMLAEEAHFIVATFGADIGFSIKWFVLCALALYWTPASYRRRAVGVLGFAGSIVLLVVGLDLAYFARTGQHITAQVVEFVLANIGSMIPIIAAEMSWSITLLVLVAPSLLLIVWRPLYRSADGAYMNRPSVVAAIGLLGLSFLLQSPLAIQSPSPLYAAMTRSPLTGLAHDYLIDPGRAISGVVRREFTQTGGPQWHSSNLRLVPAREGRKLNVVIVMLESIRARSTTLHSPDLRTTPFLEKLSRNALVVDNMYAVIPRTESAWISILYGLYPIDDMSLRPWVEKQATKPGPRSLPEILRGEGYASAFFVPTHLNLDKEREILESMRFDVVVSEKDLAPYATGWQNYMGYEDNVMVRPIYEWMSAQSAASRPFLLTVMTNVSHHDYQTPTAWATRDFAPKSEAKGLYNAYLNCIAYTDAFVANLFESVERLGLEESTIFVVVGDHGDAMTKDGWVTTRNLYDDAVKVPALIYAPQFKGAPRRIGGVRQQIDLLPTIADLLQYRIEGASLPGTSLLADIPDDRRIYLSGNIERSFLGVRAASRKTIYHYRRSAVEVIDLVSDPTESNGQAVDNSSVEGMRIEDELLLWRERSRMALVEAPDRDPP